MTVLLRYLPSVALVTEQFGILWPLMQLAPASPTLTGVINNLSHQF
jgi:hypothetical protein